jgi:hypothetical protein
MRNRIFGAFGAALRRGDFSRKDKKGLGGGTVEETLVELGQMFRVNVGFNLYYGQDIHAPHPLLF